MEKVDGIKGIFRNNGQIQLIIGTGSVEKVYEEFLKINKHALVNKKTILEKMMQLQYLQNKMMYRLFLLS